MPAAVVSMVFAVVHRLALAGEVGRLAQVGLLPFMLLSWYVANPLSEDSVAVELIFLYNVRDVVPFNLSHSSL